MTAPLFLLDDGALDGARRGDVVRLGGAEGRHASVVRRIGRGEAVDAADGSGRVARCTVDAVRGDTLDLRVLAVEQVPEPSPRFVLVQALAKGGRDELAVESATELGVDVVVPWQAARSVVVWKGDRGERARQKWADAARAAAKQSRRPRVPAVEGLADLARVADRCSRAALALVLHEDADHRLADLDLPEAGDVVLVVGPEGGIDALELARLTQAGARAVRLGREVLRSSTAGPAALAVLSARAGRW